MAKKEWVNQWKVPSRSNLEKLYTVSEDSEGKLFCSCPASVFRKQECPHIKAVLDGAFDSQDGTEPEFILAAVNEVTPIWEDGKVVKVHVPLMPFNDAHFKATIVSDCLRAGVSMSTLKKRKYTVAKKNSKQKILDYVEAFGRKVWTSIEPRDSSRSITPPLKPIPPQTKLTVGGLLFVYGESHQHYYWEHFDGDDVYLILQPKYAKVDYWAVQHIDADDRVRPLNSAIVDAEGNVIEADPLYRAGEAEPPAEVWMERLADYLNNHLLEAA